MTGRHDVKRVSIDDAVFSENKEVLEDLLAAAVNDAVRKVEARNRDAMSGLASGFLPRLCCRFEERHPHHVV
jgi:DNA-binding protein YbaB